MKNNRIKYLKDFERVKLPDFKSDTNVIIKEKSNQVVLILKSLRTGLNSFLLVFFLLAAAKLLAFSTSSINEFNMGTNEVVFSIWGFLIGSFITFSSQKK